jgi:hypothetical protein
MDYSTGEGGRVKEVESEDEKMMMVKLIGKKENRNKNKKLTIIGQTNKKQQEKSPMKTKQNKKTTQGSLTIEFQS